MKSKKKSEKLGNVVKLVVVGGRNFKNSLYPKTSNKRELIFDYLKEVYGKKIGTFTLNPNEVYNLVSSLKVNSLVKKEGENFLPLKKTDSENGFARLVKNNRETIKSYEVEISRKKNEKGESRYFVVVL